MNNYILLLPLIFLKFWFFEAPREMIGFFTSLNNAFLHLFSLPLLLRTFFKPLKNEYREGLVWFSIAAGMAVKSIIIVVDILMLMFLMVVEVLVVIGFIVWPLATVGLLFM